jgi:hypothetical protein
MLASIKALFTNPSKKDLAIAIILLIVAIGAVVVDIIGLIQMIEQWKLLISIAVLNGALVGLVAWILKILAAAKAKTPAAPVA